MNKCKLLLILFCFVFHGNAKAVDTTPSECVEDLAFTELIMVCQFSMDAVPPGACDTASVMIQYGPDCPNNMSMKIFVANLLGYNQSPPGSGKYPLPANVPDIYVEYDSNFDGIYDAISDPINEFDYHGMTAGGNLSGTHYIFEHQLELVQTLDNVCDPLIGQNLLGTLPVRLVQEDLINGGFVLYDLEPFSGHQDIFSCKVFHETCGYCPGNGSYCTPFPPEYHASVCIDCLTSCSPPGLNTRRGTEAEEVKPSSTMIQKITPNPFKDEVRVNIQAEEETSVYIEIMDMKGRLLKKYTVALSKGEQVMTLDLSDLSPGVYYCRFNNADEVETKKILKIE